MIHVDRYRTSSHVNYPFRSSSTLSGKSIDGRQIARRKRMIGGVCDVDVSFCRIPTVILHNGVTSWPVLYVVEFCISVLSRLDTYPHLAMEKRTSYLQEKQTLQCRDNSYEYMCKSSTAVLSQFVRRFLYPEKLSRLTVERKFALVVGTSM